MSLKRFVPRAIGVLLAVWALAPGLAGQGPARVRDTGDYLYRFVIVQAAPGKLLDLIELYRSRMPVVAAGGDELPLIVRHSQGDHWDLCIIYPSGSFTEYYSKERVAKRQAAGDASGVPNAEFARRFYSMVSWHEDLVRGRARRSRCSASTSGAWACAHFEMLLALAGQARRTRSRSARWRTSSTASAGAGAR
ncbi:MAG: hypothetical protein MZV64_43390 [Ignavibacteriales bacterium]|nr:hypothetical protein [Ignavibacteriales bacterium]